MKPKENFEIQIPIFDNTRFNRLHEKTQKWPEPLAGIMGAAVIGLSRMYHDVRRNKSEAWFRGLKETIKELAYRENENKELVPNPLVEVGIVTNRFDKVQLEGQLYEAGIGVKSSEKKLNGIIYVNQITLMGRTENPHINSELVEVT